MKKEKKKGNYINLINDKFKKYKTEIKKKNKILEEMYKIIEKNNKNLITPEMKKELGIKEEEIKEPVNNNNDQISFVVLNKSDFEDIKK